MSDLLEITEDLTMVTTDDKQVEVVSVGTQGPSGPSYQVNVKDFGAYGDGITDDTAAIQAAINSLTMGGCVTIPAGTYIVDPAVSINLVSDTTIEGSGRATILKIKANSNVLNNLVKAESVSRVTIRNLVIDGNNANQNASDSIAVHYGVYLAHSNDSRVENVYVHHTTGVGIHIYDSTGTVIRGCESSYNRYHGFECEQDTSTIWQGNRGHHNTRHGIFVSPGEVGGTGSIGNIINGNSFDHNLSYGIAFGIDAAGGSIGLTKNNSITNNSIIGNAEYGVSIYRVNDVLMSNNIIGLNGFFGLYLYRAERNQITSNRFYNDSQASNGAYDEMLLEGANDGQASQHNLIANNFILIDSAKKANWAIREATANDGANVIKNNYIPNAGVSGKVLAQHVNTAYELLSDTPKENTSSLKTFDDGIIIAPGATLPGATMGLDAPFGDAVLRMFSDQHGLQFVAPNGALDMYIGGVNMLSVTGAKATAQKLRIQSPNVPTSATSAGDAGDVAWNASYIFICIATNTWKRVAIATW
ncbi:hypothetical protein E3O44_12655 [Cryobacterium algoricola]|uniref:Pectate lyase superfamily protein domain-containing protein n=1 Tax=Cryobacterium algoricola TaxID=1259183 RepID=A0ABY2IDK0_9MICO|nr:right-handed parallel beta-helix repeat-containing protein [Cryobacterium algoricola]TFB85846.1 hypothetical protein E3O44_12655 [Cryobacterium algoricola]